MSTPTPSPAEPSGDPAGTPGGLRRRLGVQDAALVGLGAMIGAGIFSAPALASRAAGTGMLLALGLAAAVAYANAHSSARLAARYPSSGGTYVYGRERLGDFWGHLAGWAFVVGKTASCAAMALTVGMYVWPGQAHVVAVAAVVALTVVNCAGVHKSMLLNRLIVAVVLAVLTAVVVAVAVSGRFETERLGIGGGSGGYANLLGGGGVLEAAGLLFFAFAGYARIATLGEEVREPSRTIPRAIGYALALTLAVYAVVIVAALATLGADGLAGSEAPLSAVVRAADAGFLVPVVRAGAAVAALGALLALVLGVSRTALAMARDRHLPHALAAVHPVRQVPQRAVLVVGAVVSVVAATADLRGVIGFSSFGVLVYYAVANASAWTLRPEEGRPPRAVPVLGLVGCLVLAFALPVASVVAGAAVVAAGAVSWAVRRKAA